MWQKMKIILEGRLIASMKRFDALITTQKTLALCKDPFLMKKIYTKKIGIKKKMVFFVWLLLIFFINGTLQRVEVFCVAISSQGDIGHSNLFLYNAISGKISFWYFRHQCTELKSECEKICRSAYEETLTCCRPKPPTTTPAVFARYICVYKAKLKTVKKFKWETQRKKEQ